MTEDFPVNPDFDGAITFSGNCGVCSDPSCLDRTVRTRQDAASVLRGRGWRLTAEFGWLCKRCFEQQANIGTLTVDSNRTGR